MLFETGQGMASWLAESVSWHHSLAFWFGQSSAHWTVLAQDFSDVDIIADITKAFGNFIASGQVWALVIGLIIGYFLKSITK